ncbi:MAG: hypothetical protein C0594_02825, partial [Marinilabiliales bacterium]
LFSSGLEKLCTPVVEPLLGAIEWDQNGMDGGWNSACPEDASAPWYAYGHTFAGCVATATAMIMKYYEFPTQGTGSHSYDGGAYGILSANFGTATYDWSQMPDNTATAETAELIYHVGVSVEMEYGPTGSLASSYDAVTALKTYFNYQSSAQFVVKSNYTDTDWKALIKNELDNQRPTLYRGTGDDGGHAFVCDGYDDQDYFHFNWGWGGSDNGYFLLTSLTPGDYSFTDGQMAGIGIEPEISSPELSFTQSNVSCNGGSNGSIDLSVSSGTAPYYYEWSNAATTQDLSGLSAGSYTVTVTDNNSQATTETIIITEPTALSITETITDISCNGESDGNISVSISGGTADYEYLWSNEATTDNIAALSSGSYSVTVTDANLCTATEDAYTITEPSVLSSSYTSSNESCFGANDGSIDLTVSGGTPTYTYNWSNGAETEDLSEISAGTYSVTITDDNGCSTTESNISITSPAEITADLSGTNLSCNGGSEGAVDLTVNTGVEPFLFEWTTGATTEDIAGLSAADYTVTITDNNACSITKTISITEPTVISVSANVSDITCNQQGSIDLTVSGGTSDYSFDWSNGETTEDISELSEGDYTIIVTDANGCTASDLITVETVPDMVISATTVNPTNETSSDGSISLSLSGGTAPYTFEWGSGYSEPVYENLGNGTYSVTATDASECTATMEYTLPSYTITFSITDGTNPISGASVNFNSEIKLSDESGNATYNHIPVGTGVEYTITKTGYNSVNSTIDISQNTNIDITLIDSRTAINLAVSGTPEASSVTLIWDGSGADYYNVCYYISGTSDYLFLNTSNSPFVINNLSPNTQYNAMVRSRINGEYTEYSSIISFSTADGVSNIGTNLNLSGTAEANSATFTWDGTGAEYYQLCYYVSGTTDYYYLNATSSPSSIYNLNPNTNYECMLRTSNGGQFSEYTDPVSFTTSDGSQITASNLAVSGTPEANSVTLIWDGSGADYYQICYYISGTPDYAYQNTNGSPFTVYNLNPSTQYECMIRTRGDNQYTSFSEPISFTTASGTSIIPTNLSVIGSPGTTNVTLTWDGDGADFYSICFYEAGTSNYTYKTAYTKPRTITNLQPNTQYNAKIRARSGNQFSIFSETISFTTASLKNASDLYLVNQKDKHNFNTSIYPNPFNYNFNFIVNNDSETQSYYYLVDLSGKILESSTVQNNEVNIIGENLMPGIYFLVIYNEFGIKETNKVIKTKR